MQQIRFEYIGGLGAYELDIAHEIANCSDTLADCIELLELCEPRVRDAIWAHCLFVRV